MNLTRHSPDCHKSIPFYSSKLYKCDLLPFLAVLTILAVFAVVVILVVLTLMAVLTILAVIFYWL